MSSEVLQSTRVDVFFFLSVLTMPALHGPLKKRETVKSHSLAFEKIGITVVLANFESLGPAWIFG